MSVAQFDDVEFRIVATPDAHGGTLVAGLSAFGLAGLTAVDFLVDALEFDAVGHVEVEGIPSITPFRDGRPHHPIRLFSRPDLEVTVLVGELSVPPVATEPFGAGIVDWTERAGVEDAVVLSGVPVAHGPDEHRTYFVATDDYRQRHLADAQVPAMGQGFLDGPHASLVRRGLDAPPGVCVYVTPVHAQAPDVDAAVRLVETFSEIHHLEVDAGPLRQFATEVQGHYARLAERLAEREEEAPEDRMYM